MMQQPFIWGGGGEKLSPAQAKAMRDVAAALAAQKSAPQNLGEGLSSVGDALLYNSNMARANEAESAGMEQVAQALADARASGGTDGYYDVLSNPWASEGQRLVAGSLLDRGYALEDRNTEWAREDSIRADEREYNAPVRDAQLQGFELQNETGQLQLDQLRTGYTPLVTSDERAAYGIDPADKSVWQLGPDKKLYNESPATGPAITINTGDGSKKWNETIDENNAKRYIKFQDEANAAQSALNSFAAMDQLLADPALYSGAGGEQVLALKRVASAMGLNPEGVTSAETFNALSKQAALDVMGGSLGTGFSNADRDFVIEQVANLGNTPEGNRQIVAIQQKLAQRKIEISQLATAYVEKFGQLDAGFDNVLRRYAEENPLFPKKAGGLPEGVTEDDIEHTMKIHGLTREEVLKRLGHAS